MGLQLFNDLPQHRSAYDLGEQSGMCVLEGMVEQLPCKLINSQELEAIQALWRNREMQNGIFVLRELTQ